MHTNEPGGKPLKAVILGDVERMKYHPLNAVSEQLSAILSGHMAVEFTENYGILEQSRLQSYDVLVSYSDRWNEPVADEQAEALMTYVHGGGGFVALHTGIALAAHPKLHTLIGAKFTGHPPYQELAFEALEGETGALHPIVQGIGPFRSEDEPYRYAFAEGAECEFFLSYTLDGERYPAGWVRRVGAGKVVSLMPGHNPNSLKAIEVQELIRSSCLWAAGRL